MTPDEYEFEDKTVGNYGPYIQSERKEIYHAFVKHLIEIGRAYPCFCTKEELEEMRENQEVMKIRPGYHGKFARCSRLSVEEAIEKINNGEPYVIRLGAAEILGNFGDVAVDKLIDEFNMSQDRMRLILKTESLNQDAIMEKLDPYNMGIVK